MKYYVSFKLSVKSQIKPEFPSGKSNGTEGGESQAKARGPPVEKLVPPDGGWGWFIVLGSGITMVGKVIKFSVIN